MEDRLLALVEGTFSKDNLEKDKYLVSKMDSKSFVPLSIIIKFPKVSALLPQQSREANMAILVNALRQSRRLQVEEREDGAHVRPFVQKHQQQHAESPKHASQQDASAQAQAVWFQLTEPAAAQEEIEYSFQDLLSLESIRNVIGLAQMRSAQSGKAFPHPQEEEEQTDEEHQGTGALAQVLNQPPSNKDAGQTYQARTREPPSTTYRSPQGVQEAWADKAARRRFMFQKTTGYNKGMMEVHVCKGPDGVGFPPGRGKPLSPPQ